MKLYLPARPIFLQNITKQLNVKLKMEKAARTPTVNYRILESVEVGFACDSGHCMGCGEHHGGSHQEITRNACILYPPLILQREESS